MYNNIITKFGMTLLVMYVSSAHATDVSTWSELNDAVGDNIVFVDDVSATDTPTTISLNSVNPQTIDGGGYSLNGASGYQIRKISGTDLTIQNFGSLADGTLDDYTYSYVDAEGNTIYKKITGSINGFNKTLFGSNNLNNLSIADSVFYNNTGTVMDLKLSNAANTASITNVVLYGNTNTTSDFALLSLGQGTFDIDNLFYVSNQASEFAVGINVVGGTVNINDSIIQNNGGSYYGALQIDDGFVNIDGSQFVGNSTLGDGGAISETKGLSDITNTLFKNNHADGIGGAIWAPLQQNAEILPYLLNVTFEGNSADSVGGGFYVVGAGQRSVESYVVNSNFNGNSASWGGGIYTGNLLYLAVVDTSFINNTANEGAAIYAADLDLNIYAETKDVLFSGNTATYTTENYNGGAAVYFEFSGNEDVALNINAASGHKVIFDNTIASAGEGVVLNVNKSGLVYTNIEGLDINIADAGEIQFNDKVGDESENIFNINLYGGMLSVGQNATLNAGFDDPDALLNNNNLSVLGAATLNTVNGIIGQFAPATFEIDAALSWQLDVDLSNAEIDTLGALSIGDEGALTLTSLNIISDADVDGLRLNYSSANIGGILADEYTITTSEGVYSIIAQNDENGSGLVFNKMSDIGGLAAAIQNGSDAYSITEDTDEVIDGWGTTNSLSANLTVNGNNHGFITTEDDLDGIDIGEGFALTMNNVSDVCGFNYAFNNSGTVNLTNTTISDEIINNGVIEIQDGVTIGAVYGNGVTNINSNFSLTAAFAGNTLNVKNAELTGVNYLATDVDLNLVGGTVVIDNNAVAINSANFDANSTLAVSINSLSDYGSLTANTITVADGATLRVTLAQGLAAAGDVASVQLLSANNTDFNNFADVFDNNMYHFEKANGNGLYNISLVRTAKEVVKESGGPNWVANAAAMYVDKGNFGGGTVAADIANKLADLAQNDSEQLVETIRSLAPAETTVAQGQVLDDVNRLFGVVDGYLRGERAPMGISGGDSLNGLSIWAKPYIGKSKLRDRGHISGFSTESLGGVVGVEQQITRAFKMGVGAQYDVSEIKSNKRDIDANTIVGFVYGEYKPYGLYGKQKTYKWFVNGVLSFGLSDYDENKYTLGTIYNANYDVRMMSAAAMTGCQMGYFTPEVGLRYYHIHRDEYTDTAMQMVGAEDTNILRAVGGLHITRNFKGFQPDVHLGLTYDVITGAHDTTVNLSNGMRYVVSGEDLNRLGYELDVGFNLNLVHNIVLGASYFGAYREKYMEHTGMIRVKYSF